MTRKSLNEKKFDLILEEAAEKYIDESPDNEDFQLTEEEMQYALEAKERVHKKLMAKIEQDAPKKHKKLSIKKIFIIAACITVISALAINTSAVKVFMYKTYLDFRGDSLNVTTKKVELGKYDSIKEFEHKNEIIVPGWLPPGMELTKMLDMEYNLRFEYKMGDKFLNLTQLSISRGYVSDENFAADNNKFKIEDIKILGTDAKLIEMTNELGIKTYTAIWLSDNVKYELDTNVDETMAKSIIWSLEYYGK